MRNMAPLPNIINPQQLSLIYPVKSGPGCPKYCPFRLPFSKSILVPPF